MTINLYLSLNLLFNILLGHVLISKLTVVKYQQVLRKHFQGKYSSVVSQNGKNKIFKVLDIFLTASPF